MRRAFRTIPLLLSGAVTLAACTPAADIARLSAPQAGFAPVSATARQATGADAVWLQAPEQIAANA